MRRPLVLNLTGPYTSILQWNSHYFGSSDENQQRKAFRDKTSIKKIDK